jgi:hypothetical protein
MPSASVSIDTILERLAETPRRIAALTAGLTSAQLHASFAEHLARHERTHLKQFKRIAERVSA